MNEAGAWTDERVELLKKLWSDGLSASQIAAELGNVTRNAVIGKVHRLGLSGRAKSAAAPAAPRKAEPAQKDADTMALEKLMTDTLGMIVTIEHKDRGGAIRVAYRTLDQLDELCRRLKDER